MNRNQSLDVLRAVAMLLVLGRHAHWPSDHWLCAAWNRGGWIGVDLFFVLSGFLISGLLFADRQKHGSIDWRRFYIRRALKIYPGFWLLILFAAFTYDCNGIQIAGELLFVQNYAANVFASTWSLAVEEHFYLILPWLLMALPSDRLPRVALLVGILLPLARLVNVAPFHAMTHIFPTHLRFDSLFFGVLLCHWYRTWPAYKTFCSKHALLLYLAGVGLCLPAFVWPIETRAIHTIGFTSFYLGSGAILSAAVCRGLPNLRILASLGRYSYSIYLWQTVVLDYVRTDWMGVTLYFVGSVVVGILAAMLVEIPCLRFRDRLFPAENPHRQLAPAPAVS